MRMIMTGWGKETKKRNRKRQMQNSYIWKLCSEYSKGNARFSKNMYERVWGGCGMSIKFSFINFNS